ncbi:glycosyltransferase [Weissella halotolerans]|uniref:Teichoic acid biosynthesis protein n=1 Tax=Weissella halotolerans DSM 20190 TaxID=1123500 RepID=A0A0R2FYA8_9LACO|nr:glycosyltransferase [Weissella halotolerans]KRN33439.1 teichoic acid biosynthesis protein [Weissella halotolerans DSM 20190]
MNKLFYKTANKFNNGLRRVVRETSNFKLISRMYAAHYNKIAVREQTYFYETRDGQNFTDSPVQMLTYLLKTAPQAQHYITYQKDYLQEVKLAFELNGIDLTQTAQIHLVERDTADYVEALLSAKYLITDSTLQSFFVKKTDQVYINTWHGTPLKSMGYAMPEGNFDSWNVMRNFMMADYIVSPNQHTTNLLLTDYRLNGLYPGKIAEVGYPRNDVFFNQTSQARLRQYLVNHYQFANDKPTLVYAPTWKPDDLRRRPMEVALDYVNTYEQVRQQLGDRYNILMKVHPFVYNRIKKIDAVANFLVNDGINANDLLAVTDLLVTDFSSIFFDFLLTDKPIIFFNPDAEAYQKERGYYFPLESLPGPSFSNLTDLATYVKAGDFSQYQANYDDFKQRFVSHDHGHTTEKLMTLVSQDRSDDPAIVKAQLGKKKVLIYTGGMQNNGISAALINLVNHLDYERYDVSLLTADNRHDIAFYNNFNKLTDQVRVFVVRGESSYGWLKLFGKSLAEKYGRFPWMHALYSKKQAALNTSRLVGNQSFDVAIDFDSYVMNNGQWIAATDAKQTYNVLHNDMWLETHKKIDGQLKNPKTLHYLYFWRLFDKTLSVSEGTRKINDRKLGKYINRSGVLTNIIDADHIIALSKAQVTYKPLDISELRATVDMTNSADITAATFGHIDLDKRVASLHQPDPSRAARTFITNSRLSPEKNLDNLILAFIKLHARYPEVELKIFGNDVGHYAPLLYELVLEHQAQDYIHFYGYAENTFPAIAQADVFLLPSHTEGQSIALMEAMVLKKNIMASNVLANIELLANGSYGLLTEGNDEAALLAGLELMAAGRYTRLKDFDATQHNQLTLKQFDQLFKGE